MLRVAVHFPPKKLHKQRIADLLQYLRDHHCHVTTLDLSQPLDAQGPFDVVLHKFTDLVVQAQSDQDAQATQQLDSLYRWAAAHPTMIWIDPLDAMVRLTDRIATSHALEMCIARNPGLFRVPASVVVGETDDTAKVSHRLSLLRFPVVVKTGDACGSKLAHQMAVAFEPAHVIAVLAGRSRVLVQEFIRHDNVMHKCYVLNGHVRVDVRSSLDLPAPNSASGAAYTQPPFEFDSQTISKRIQASGVVATTNVDIQRIDKIGVALASVLDLRLFGFDLIVEESTHDLFVVDVNYFPAYDGVPDFFERMHELIQQASSSTRPPANV